jgi:hypothetical protein
MTVKIALDSNEDTRWIGVLLGSETSLKGQASPLAETDESDAAIHSEE